MTPAFGNEVMARKPDKDQPQVRRGRGFARAATLLKSHIRKAGESRGFAVTRLLTHWEEIAGADLARTTRPVKVGYGREGLGATLTVLTTGANAPILEMQKDRLRERVNACYGYAAISKIRITQTAPMGFAEGQAKFRPAPERTEPVEKPEIRAAAQSMTAPVADEKLRRALAALGASVLSRNRT